MTTRRQAGGKRLRGANNDDDAISQVAFACYTDVYLGMQKQRRQVAPSQAVEECPRVFSVGSRVRHVRAAYDPGFIDKTWPERLGLTSPLNPPYG